MQEYRYSLLEEEKQEQKERSQRKMQEYRSMLSGDQRKVQRIRNWIQCQDNRRNDSISVKQNNFDNITYDDLKRIDN